MLSVMPTPPVKDYKSPCALVAFQTQGYRVCNFPAKVAPAPWWTAVVLETPWPFQLCPPSPYAQMVATSEMVPVCLIPGGVECGNLSHAKKTVSQPAVAPVAVNLLLANLPAFQQLPAWVLFVNPFAPV